MERQVKLSDWIGKTIKHAEIKGEYYLIYFTDDSIISMKSYIYHVEKGFSISDDWSDIEMKLLDIESYKQLK